MWVHVFVCVCVLMLAHWPNEFFIPQLARTAPTSQHLCTIRIHRMHIAHVICWRVFLFVCVRVRMGDIFAAGYLVIRFGYKIITPFVRCTLTSKRMNKSIYRLDG